MSAYDPWETVERVVARRVVCSTRKEFGSIDLKSFYVVNYVLNQFGSKKGS